MSKCKKFEGEHPPIQSRADAYAETSVNGVPSVPTQGLILVAAERVRLGAI